MKKITLIILTVFLCFGFSSCQDSEEPPKDEKIKFNQEIWMNEPDERYRMVDDIVESEILIDMSREEIEDLLGESDANDFPSVYIQYDLNNDNLKYGMHLAIVFKNEKAVEAGSWNDEPTEDNRIKFDRESWLNEPKERRRMADDIQRSEILTGLSYEEVKDLLGEINMVEFQSGMICYELRYSNIVGGMYFRIDFEDGEVTDAYWFNDESDEFKHTYDAELQRQKEQSQ